MLKGIRVECVDGVPVHNSELHGGRPPPRAGRRHGIGSGVRDCTTTMLDPSDYIHLLSIPINFSAFLVYHLSLIYRGLTTNESYKWGKEHLLLLLSSPF